MRQREFLRRLADARARADGSASAQAAGGDHITRGLSREGYVGGYIQALDDIEAILTHGYPGDPRGFWRD